MKFFSIVSWCAVVLLFVTTLFLTASGTWVEDVVRKVGMGSFIDFVVEHNAFLVSFLVVLWFLKYSRDWRILLAVGLVVYLLRFSFHLTKDYITILVAHRFKDLYGDNNHGERKSLLCRL